MNKAQLATTNVTAKTGLSGKTVSTVEVYRTGMQDVVDILCTDSTRYYLKFKGGLCEVGGTADWGTGTAVGGR